MAGGNPSLVRAKEMGERKRASGIAARRLCPGGGLIPPASMTAQPLAWQVSRRRAERAPPLREDGNAAIIAAAGDS